MKKSRVLPILVFLLAAGSVLIRPVNASPLPEPAAEDPVAMRPEEYLLSLETFPQALTEKYPNEVIKEKSSNQTKLPNLYKAENILVWGEDNRITTRIMVGVPGYWDGYYLRGRDSFDRVTELQGLGDYALLLDSSFSHDVRFMKGNSVVEVSLKRGGDINDAQLIAQMIADQLPDELPHPDSWQVLVPEPAKNISLPSKYIYSVFKSGEQGVFYYKEPDHDNLRLISRYPFTSFTMALWNEELQSYVYLEEVNLSIYDLTVLSGEHSARVNSLTYGDYEIHYWVNGEFSYVYPFTIK